MKKYKKKNGKSAKEKAGIYAVLSICVVAVALAVWSTYQDFNDWREDENNFNASLQQISSESQDVSLKIIPTESEKTDDNTPIDEALNNEIVYENEQFPTTEAKEATEAKETITDEEAMQTALNSPIELSYPVENPRIIQGFCDQGVYNDTMKDYRTHTGIDIAVEQGKDVKAMCSGIVKNVYTDDLLGNVIVIRNGEIDVMYCGLSEDINLSKDDAVTSGDVIGKVGVVPFEANEEAHIHIEVLVKENPIDPLTLISKNE